MFIRALMVVKSSYIHVCPKQNVYNDFSEEQDNITWYDIGLHFWTMLTLHKEVNLILRTFY